MKEAKIRRTFKQFCKDNKKKIIRGSIIAGSVLASVVTVALVHGAGNKAVSETVLDMGQTEAAPMDNIVNFDDVASL